MISAQYSFKLLLLIISLLVVLLLTACNDSGGVSTNTLPNTPPVVESVSTTVVKNTAKTVTLLGVDAQGDSLTYSVVSNPVHGTVSISGNVATYTPAANYTGLDGFTYKANDGKADSVVGKVSITVVNYAPTASAVSTSTDEDTSKVITLAGSDSDGDSLTYTKMSDPAHGAVSFSGNVATYTPVANYTGLDSFIYKASDGTADSSAATVSITVAPVNDAPVAVIGNDVVNEGGTVTLNSAASTDIDGTVVGWHWEISDGAGLTITLSDPSASTPTFVVPALTEDKTIEVSLVVTDNESVSSLLVTRQIFLKNLPGKPQNVSAVPREGGVTITWEPPVSNDAEGYKICYAKENISNVNICSALQGGVLLLAQTSPAIIDNLDAGTRYHFVITPNTGAFDGTSSDEVVVITPAKVGFYDLEANGAGSGQDIAILQADQLPLSVGDIANADLNQYQVLFVQNPDNGGYTESYLNNIEKVFEFVRNGGVLVFHDRNVTDASQVLPGNLTGFVRELDEGGVNVDVLTTNSVLADGPGGIIDATTLDGGNFSSHGYFDVASAPADSMGLLSRSDPGQWVTFSYPYGEGYVVYSSIPLDYYLEGWRDIQGFSVVYAPNVVAYAAQLYCCGADANNGSLLSLVNRPPQAKAIAGAAMRMPAARAFVKGSVSSTDSP